MPFVVVAVAFVVAKLVCVLLRGCGHSTAIKRGVVTALGRVPAGSTSNMLASAVTVEHGWLVGCGCLRLGAAVSWVASGWGLASAFRS